MTKLWRTMALMVLLFGPAARAHYAGPPQPTSFYSLGLSYIAEIFPPHSRQKPGETALCFFYAVGAPGSDWQIDAHLVWEGPLVNGRMPDEAVISSEGDLVTLNEYDVPGYENAVVIYGRDGKLVKAYALEQLIPPAELQRLLHDGKVPADSSSRYWNLEATYLFALQHPQSFYIRFPWKAVLRIPLDGGAPRYTPASSRADLDHSGWEKGGEGTEVSRHSLRFSSITDVLAARLGAH